MHCTRPNTTHHRRDRGPRQEDRPRRGATSLSSRDGRHRGLRRGRRARCGRPDPRTEQGTPSAVERDDVEPATRSTRDRRGVPPVDPPAQHPGRSPGPAEAGHEQGALASGGADHRVDDPGLRDWRRQELHDRPPVHVLRAVTGHRRRLPGRLPRPAGELAARRPRRAPFGRLLHGDHPERHARRPDGVGPRRHRGGIPALAGDGWPVRRRGSLVPTVPPALEPEPRQAATAEEWPATTAGRAPRGPRRPARREHDPRPAQPSRRIPA